MRIELPWPPSKTSANGSQGDYMGKARAAKSYRVTCQNECIAQGVKPIPWPEYYIPVTITYHPPRDGRFDWDNISNRAKQGFDGVAHKTGIDDGRWWPVTLRRGEKIKGGRIIIEMGAQDTAIIPFKGKIS